MPEEINDSILQFADHGGVYRGDTVDPFSIAEMVDFCSDFPDEKKIIKGVVDVMAKKFGASSAVFRLRSRPTITTSELQTALKNDLGRTAEFPIADAAYSQAGAQICAKAAGRISQWLKDAHPIPRREFLKKLNSKGLVETVGCDFD